MINLILNNLALFNAEHHDFGGDLRKIDEKYHEDIKNHKWKKWAKNKGLVRNWTCERCKLEMGYYSKNRMRSTTGNWGVCLFVDSQEDGSYIFSCSKLVMMKVCQ